MGAAARFNFDRGGQKGAGPNASLALLPHPDGIAGKFFSKDVTSPNILR